MTATAASDAPWPGLSRGLTVVLTGAGAMIMVAGLRAFSASIGPMFLALIILLVVYPVHGMLTRRGAPSWLATIGTTVVSFSVLAVMAAALAWAMVQLIDLVASDEYSDRLAAAEEDIVGLLETFGLTEDDLNAAIEGIDIVGLIASYSTIALSSATAVLTTMSIMGFAGLFVAIDAPKFTRSLDAVERHRPAVTGALRAFASQTRSYFVVSTVFGLIVAVIDVAALWLLGVPLAIVWGVVSFITNYIPNVGFFVGLIPPATLAFLEGGWSLALWVVITYSVINVVIQSIIQPKFVGDAVGLSTTLTFVSLIFWGWVLGPFGALLAVPMTLLAKALLVDIDPATRWLDPLISLDPDAAKRPIAAGTDATRGTSDGHDDPRPQPIGGPS